MANGKILKILIVDDDAFIQNMYAAKFSKDGHEVVTARSGADVLGKMKEGLLPDVVLLDVVLPGMDGIEILREIRKENLAPEAKYIMLTNESADNEISEAKKLGAVGFITKALLTPSEVVSKVLEIVGK